MLSGRVDRLNHMASVKSHAEPREITSDKGASSLPPYDFMCGTKHKVLILEEIECF